MEDVREVYQRPYDAAFPQVCLDETTKQLVARLHETVRMEPGKPNREDYEYERKGTCSVFLACEPLTGHCFVQARHQHTRLDFAHFVQELLEGQYPHVEKVVLVMDN